MANHPQAEKRTRQRARRQAHNRHYKSTMRTYLKRVVVALRDKKVEDAKSALKAAIPVVDRCASKSVIPKRRASRIVSRLTHRVNELAG